MRPAWATGLSVKASGFLSALDRSVENLCAEHIDDLVHKRIVPQTKIVQDSLWGFIRIEPSELVLIDSPLIQRLRFIRQLGFAFQLFPNAGYSRFEHSLGVCHIVTEFARAIKEAQKDGPDISLAQIQELRLAALLHDVGHIAFSHVSERGLRHFKPLQECVEEIRSAILLAVPDLRKPPSVSEILSVCICISPTVNTLLGHALSVGAIHANLDSLQETICDYILGNANDPKKWFLAELISGGLDGDKLDYIPRDCMVTGVPLPFDVRRLILKTRIAKSTDSNHPFYRLGVSFTGARALYDLTVSRSMLREKIYRHPKVMAAEAMYDATMALAADINPDGLNASNLLLYDDERAWEILNDISTQSPQKTENLLTTLTNLRRRRLLKRAFAFSSFFFPSENVPETWGSKLGAIMANEEQTLKLRDKIFNEVLTILKALKRSSEQLKVHDIAVVQVDLKSGAGSEQHVPAILDDEGSIVENLAGWQHFSASTDWAVAHEAGSALNYVFSPQHLRVEAHVATRNVFARDYGLQFRNPSALLARVSPSEIKKLDRRILDSFQEEDARRDYRNTLLMCSDTTTKEITDEFLTAARLDISASTVMVIQSQQSRVNQKMLEVSVFDGYRGHRMSKRRLDAWVAQFDRNLQRDALELFLNVELLDRSKFVDAIKKAVENLKQVSSCNAVFIAPLTSSGDFIKYYALDTASDGIALTTAQSVSQAVSKISEAGPKAALLIVDDVLGSGAQFEDVLRIWFGESPEHENPGVAERLTTPAVQYITSDVPISFVWCFGLDEGRQRIERLLSERHIRGVPVFGRTSSIGGGVFGRSSPIKFSDSNGFKEQCQAFGLELLQQRARERSWPEDKLRQRSLGYSGASQVVVTPYNCPTITLPILWALGRVRNREWIPLFCRRFRT